MRTIFFKSKIKSKNKRKYIKRKYIMQKVAIVWKALYHHGVFIVL